MLMLRALRRRAAEICLALICLWAAAPAQAQMNWGEEYARRVRATEQVSPLGDDAFGDRINLYNGTVSFEATDISLPGNNALPVRLRRYYDPQDVSLPRFLGKWDLDIPYISAIAPEGHTGGFPVPLKWTTSVEFKKEWYWSGDRLNIGGSGSDLLGGPVDPKRVIPGFLTDGWHTKSGWYFSAIPVRHGAGIGYVGYAPDGTRYTFDWLVERDYSAISHPWRTINGTSPVLYRKKLALFVSKIEDRFGNWVKYEWEGNHPTRIHSSDGRAIDLNMTLTNTTAYGREVWSLMSATAAGKTWTYNGSPSVVNPDGTRWEYLHEGHRLDVISYERIPTAPSGPQGYVRDDEIDCAPTNKFLAQSAKYTVVHPSGARAEFNFAPVRHGRTQVKFMCLSNNNPENEQADSYRNEYATFHDVWSVQSKVISGVALPTATTAYSYSGLRQGYQEQDETQFPFEPGWNARNAPAAPNRKTVTVTEPDGTQQIHTFGKDWEIDEGQLLKVETKKDGVVHKTLTHAYVTYDEALGLPFPETMGSNGVRWGDTLPGANRPLKSTTLVQDGTTFTWAVPSTCNGNNTLCFDAHARPVRETKSSSLGGSKTDITEYFDQTNPWVLGQVKRTLSFAGGITRVNGSTSFDPTSLLPLVSYGPCRLSGTSSTPNVAGACTGKTLQEMSYTLTSNTDDQHTTLRTVTDGRGNTITLSNWFRGVPQEIRHPATTEAPEGGLEEAAVNLDGTLAWVEDELDNRTCYQYDGAGRLSRITYPSDTPGVCNETRFLATTLSLTKAAAAAYGLPAGHWQHAVQTSNARKVAYLDAFWRPVVDEAYDAASPSTTRSVTVKRYDIGGQLAFQSFAQRSLVNYAALTQGTRTSYDALNRVTRVEQDSELGSALATVTDYLSQSRVQVTNPRGYVTTTSFTAFDKPTTDLPVAISQAKGTADEALTQIVRDPFGLPTELKRGNPAGTLTAVRSYGYDAHDRLCRTVEPETGTTAMGYDAAGNPAWTAAGLPTGTLCDAEGDTSAILPRRVTRSFDARNRVASLTFPDGLGNQTWSYTKDGLPASVTTYNGANNTNPVINAYSYNVRRQLTGENASQPGRYSWSLGYGYNAYGHPTSLTQPSGEILSFAPNALGQSTKVTGSANYATAVSYHPNGALAQFTYGNGIVHTMTQNLRGLPELSADVLGSGATAVKVLHDEYDFDANGNVAAITDGATGTNQRGNRTMTYDALDRLKRAQSIMFGSTTSSAAAYTYDVLDNITRVTINSTPLVPGRDQYYCYDTNSGRLTAVRTLGCTTGGGSATVESLYYDPQGNLSNKSGQGFEFDFGNRLRSATGKETYRYDAHGRRVQATAATGDILSQYGQNGALRYQQDFRRSLVLGYVHLSGSLIAITERPMGTSTTTIKYQHTDALGSPVVVTNASGQVIKRNEYEPYGGMLGGAVEDGPGYTGHVSDKQTGLSYMQQRYYDPKIGRFLSVDPVTADVASGANFNRYWYANNNPYRFNDPDGRSSNCAMEACFSATIVKTFGDVEAVKAVQSSDYQLGKGDAAEGEAPPVGRRLDVSNPGAVHTTPEEAGAAANRLINPISIRVNAEFMWAYVQNKQTQLWAFTDPYRTGKEGQKDFMLSLTSNGKPVMSTFSVKGTGHTHGDYSRRVNGNIVRVDKLRDGFRSDAFSSDDRTDMPTSDYDFFTVGTPSGRAFKWERSEGVSPLEL